MMDQGISQGRHRGDDPKVSGRRGADQPLLSAAARLLGTTHKRAQCKYTVEFNVFF